MWAQVSWIGMTWGWFWHLEFTSTETKSLMALQAVSLPGEFESAIKETQAQTGRQTGYAVSLSPSFGTIMFHWSSAWQDLERCCCSEYGRQDKYGALWYRNLSRIINFALSKLLDLKNRILLTKVQSLSQVYPTLVHCKSYPCCRWVEIVVGEVQGLLYKWCCSLFMNSKLPMCVGSSGMQSHVGDMFAFPMGLHVLPPRLEV